MIRLAVLIVVALVMGGCTNYWTTIDKEPKLSEPTARLSTPTVCSAGISEFVTLSNGIDSTPSSEFLKRFSTELKSKGVFQSVAQDVPTNSNELVVLSLHTKENQDVHQGGNVAKGFFIGLTFFLLTPVLPLSYEFESEFLLTAKGLDGTVKNYAASGAGHASYQLYANAAEAASAVRGTVTGNNLHSIVNQVMLMQRFCAGQTNG